MIKELIEDKQLESLNFIERWQLKRKIRTDNVAQHSYWVTFFSMILVDELLDNTGFSSEYKNLMKLQVMCYAMNHDITEISTGDISHEVKNNSWNGSSLRKLLKELEERFLEERFSSREEISMRNIASSQEADQHIKEIVKVADWMSFLQYLTTEKSLGNSNLDDEYNYCFRSLKISISNCIRSLDNFGMLHNFNLKIFNGLI